MKIPELIELGSEAEKGALAVTDFARLAAIHGLLMIGTTRPRPVHWPTKTSTNHHCRNLNQDYHHASCADYFASSKLLRATGVPEIAVLGALFGDFNKQQERASRLATILGRRPKVGERFVGWKIDAEATYRRANDYFAYQIERPDDQPGAIKLIHDTHVDFSAEPASSKVWLYGINPLEQIRYAVYAMPKLINAAIQPLPGKELRGSIDFIDPGDLETWAPYPHEPGTFITHRPKETVFSISVTGDDLPFDIIPRQYDKELAS